MENPYLERRKKRGIKHGVKAEKKFAKRTGAFNHPASGAAGIKGDSTLGVFKVECKATVKASLSIKLEWLNKINKEAYEVDKLPALNIQFVDVEGNARDAGSWVLIREDNFKQIADIMDGDQDL